MNLFNKRTNKLNPYIVSTRNISSDEDWLVLDWNESTYRIDKHLKDSLTDFVNRGELNLYGDVECSDLKRKMAEIIDIEPSSIAFFNGSDSALNICFEAILDDGDKVLVIEPEYSQVDTFIHMKGGVKSSYLLEKIEKPDISEINKLLKDVKIFYFSNPNNPVGFYFDISEIDKMLTLNQNTMFFVDEAYYEFCGSSVVDLISKHSNLIVFRTFSKAFGLAGIRLGYIISNSDNILILNKLRNGKEVSSIAQFAAITVLNYYDQIQVRIDKIIEVRDWFFNQLKELPNYIVFPSNANFILVKHRDYKLIISSLKDNKILVRDRSSMNGLEDCFRITIGSKPEMIRVLEILKKY